MITKWIVQAPVQANHNVSDPLKHSIHYQSITSSLRTFGTGPIRVQVGSSSLIADLLDGLGGLVVNLKDAARPSSTSPVILIGHAGFKICAASEGRFSAHVVRDGAWYEDWGRQLGGV